VPSNSVLLFTLPLGARLAIRIFKFFKCLSRATLIGRVWPSAVSLLEQILALEASRRLSKVERSQAEPSEIALRYFASTSATLQSRRMLAK